MNRRKFLSMFGISVAAVSALPMVGGSDDLDFISRKDVDTAQIAQAYWKSGPPHWGNLIDNSDRDAFKEWLQVSPDGKYGMNWENGKIVDLI